MGRTFAVTAFVSLLPIERSTRSDIYKRRAPGKRDGAWLMILASELIAAVDLIHQS